MVQAVVAVVATALVTRRVLPEIYQEVNSAALVATGLQLIALPHLPRYLVVARKDGSVGWHVTVLVAITAVTAVGAAVFLGGPIGAWLELPWLETLLPWYAASIALSQLAAVPEWLLARRLRFRDLSLVRAGSNIVGNLLLIALIFLWNVTMMAFVVVAICSTAIRFVGMLALVERKAWLRPAPLSLARLWRILRFALPLGGASVADDGARGGDSLLFGPYLEPYAVGPAAGRRLGNLSMVDAGLDEVVFSVLAREKAKQGSARADAALLRVLGLIALVCFPVAAWVAVAAPTIVALFFNAQWIVVVLVPLVMAAGVAPLRFVGSTIGYYLQADRRTVAVLQLSLLRVVIIVGGIVFARWVFGSTPIAVGVVAALAYGGHALASMILVARSKAVSMSAIFLRVLPPVGACVVLVVVVATARIGLVGLGLSVGSPVLLLVLVVIGLGAYVVAARRLARAHTDEFITLLKLAFGKQPLGGKPHDKIAAIFD